MSTPESFPRTGDQVRAAHRMRAWENARERGRDGIWVDEGQVGLVLNVRRIGRKRTRLWLLVNDRIAMFSYKTVHLPRNWPVVARLSPISGCP